MRSPAVLTLLALVTLAACAPAAHQSQSIMKTEGTIFVGGTVLAGPAQSPLKNHAVYAEGGLIRDVGPADEIRRRYAGATVVDASSATILPGLTDAHGHLYGLGLSLDTVDLVDTKSVDEIAGRVAERASTTPAGDWIVGRGWDQNDWNVKRFPSAAPLDARVSSHPVWLKRIDGHAGWANSAAMRAAGITAATPDPSGGKIEHDERGEPTGVFIDAAMDLVEKVVPDPSFEQRKARVLASAQRIAANGLTGMHDAGADDDTIRAVRELIDEKRFPIRVYLMLGDDAPLLERWFAQGPLMNYGGRLTVRSVKLYADGALGSRGAALLEGYSDEHHNHGLVIASTEHIADVSRRAVRAGFQVNTHAIGDRGTRNVLDGYEAAGVPADRRFRIEHFQVVAPADITRLVSRGFIASMQPTHATSDMPWAEARVGPVRIRSAYAWRSVLDAGGRLALGSDFPVEQVNPFFGIHAAVTRQDHDGHPPGGWYPEQRLNLAEAIRGFTSDAAYAAFEEASRGTIEPGKLADLTIVEGDFVNAAPASLWNAKVQKTVVGGEVVYEAGK